MRRFVNLKLNPPESAEHVPPAMSPRPKSAKEGYLDAASALTLIPEDVPLRPASNGQISNIPTEQQSTSKNASRKANLSSHPVENLIRAVGDEAMRRALAKLRAGYVPDQENDPDEPEQSPER